MTLNFGRWFRSSNPQLNTSGTIQKAVPSIQSFPMTTVRGSCRMFTFLALLGIAPILNVALESSSSNASLISLPLSKTPEIEESVGECLTTFPKQIIVLSHLSKFSVQSYLLFLLSIHQEAFTISVWPGVLCECIGFAVE